MAGHSRSWLRWASVAALTGLALLLGAGTAVAHTRLQSSNPADGASVAAAPIQVTLVFNEAVKAGFSTITVVGPDGAAWQTGPVSGGGSSVSTQVRPLGPAGRYRIGYRVLSDDGHPVTGEIAFTLTAPGPGAAPATKAPATKAPTTGVAAPVPPVVTPAASTTDTGGSPVWPWLVGGVIVIAGGVAMALRLGRRQ